MVKKKGNFPKIFKSKDIAIQSFKYLRATSQAFTILLLLDPNARS